MYPQPEPEPEPQPQPEPAMKIIPDQAWGGSALKKMAMNSSSWDGWEVGDVHRGTVSFWHPVEGWGKVLCTTKPTAGAAAAAPVAPAALTTTMYKTTITTITPGASAAKTV